MVLRVAAGDHHRRQLVWLCSTLRVEFLPGETVMKKVIFDNDIGIDDAMALLFLHYSPEVELIAVTTGFGNASVADTTRNALYVKEKFAIHAPVYSGRDEFPFAGPIKAYPDFVHGKNGLGDIEIPDIELQAEETEASDAIIELVKAHPGEISIVAVGRMTNLANALKKAPEIVPLVKEVIVMGGVFGYNGHRGNVTPVAEANIIGDAQAADELFTSGLPITIVGLDVTEEIHMTAAYLEKVCASAGEAGHFIQDISAYYLDFYESRLGERQCPMHDSSAVAYLLRPELFTTKSAVVRVATEGLAIGQTISGDGLAEYLLHDWYHRPTCQFCIAVDADAVLELYADTLALAGTQK